jgi:hypothetical protein
VDAAKKRRPKIAKIEDMQLEHAHAAERVASALIGAPPRAWRPAPMLGFTQSD